MERISIIRDGKLSRSICSEFIGVPGEADGVDDVVEGRTAIADHVPNQDAKPQSGNIYVEDNAASQNDSPCFIGDFLVLSFIDDFVRVRTTDTSPQFLLEKLQVLTRPLNLVVGA